MKKLALHIEDLTVESFETSPARDGNRGTVHGNGVSDTTCHQLICDCGTVGLDCGTGDCNPDTLHCLSGPGGVDTCIQICIWSAQATCGYSCEGTCVGETCDGCTIILP